MPVPIAIPLSQGTHLEEAPTDHPNCARHIRLAVQTCEGITTEPTELTNALRAHWSTVFQAKATTRQEVLDQWVKDAPYGFHDHKIAEQLKMDDHSI